MPYFDMYSKFPTQPESSPLHERVAVVGLVVLLHLSVFALYWMQPQAPAVDPSAPHVLHPVEADALRAFRRRVCDR